MRVIVAAGADVFEWRIDAICHRQGADGRRPPDSYRRPLPAASVSAGLAAGGGDNRTDSAHILLFFSLCVSLCSLPASLPLLPPTPPGVCGKSFSCGRREKPASPFPASPIPPASASALDPHPQSAPGPSLR